MIHNCSLKLLKRRHKERAYNENLISQSRPPVSFHKDNPLIVFCTSFQKYFALFVYFAILGINTELHPQFHLVDFCVFFSPHLKDHPVAAHVMVWLSVLHLHSCGLWLCLINYWWIFRRINFIFMYSHFNKEFKIGSKHFSLGYQGWFYWGGKICLITFIKHCSFIKHC